MIEWVKVNGAWEGNLILSLPDGKFEEVTLYLPFPEIGCIDVFSETNPDDGDLKFKFKCKQSQH